MLSAPTNKFPTVKISHLNRQRNNSSTSRLSTWSQIRPFIYKTMISSNKSNSQWLHKELSSFEERLRTDYPKDIVPIIMDDHIRSVLTKYPESLHKSILKMLFNKIPKLKPNTIFFIPSSPKRQNKPKHKHKNKKKRKKHKKNKKSKSNITDSNNANAATLEPFHKNNSSDSSIIHSSSSSTDGLAHIHISDAIKLSKLNQQKTSSVSDSNYFFASTFKQQIHLNLTDEDNDNDNDNDENPNETDVAIAATKRDIEFSPSASSRISGGFDYNDNDINIVILDLNDNGDDNNNAYDGYNNGSDKTMDSTDDETNKLNNNNEHKFSIRNLLKNRKGSKENNRHQRKIFDSVDTKHLKNRISDIQNKRFESDGESNGSSPPYTVHEIDIMVNEINEEKDKKPYICSILYIFIYVINTLHLITAMWFLINMLIFSVANPQHIHVPVFMHILLYFNISTFCILQLWKLFAAILFTIGAMEKDKNSKIAKINSCQKWRLQFWICLPLIWLTNKSSFTMFFTLNPTAIEIWFDLCFHHIWMLVLSVIFIAYPYIYHTQIVYDGYFVSSVLYIITFCAILIVTFSVKYRFNISPPQI